MDLFNSPKKSQALSSASPPHPRPPPHFSNVISSILLSFFGGKGRGSSSTPWNMRREWISCPSRTSREPDGLFIVTLHNCIALLSHKIKKKKKTFPSVFKGVISFSINKHVGVRANRELMSQDICECVVITPLTAAEGTWADLLLPDACSSCRFQIMSSKLHLLLYLTERQNRPTKMGGFPGGSVVKKPPAV